MPFCDRCGSEIGEGQKFCPKCGAPARTEDSVERRIRRQDDACFGIDQRRDPLGILDLGIFLLAVGVVFQLNPDLFSSLISWIEMMADLEILVMPPSALTNSAVIFFGFIGVANFGTAAIRIAIDKNMGRILQDALSGVGLLAFAYLINLFAQGSISWRMVLAGEAIVVGVLIIAYALFRSRN